MGSKKRESDAETVKPGECFFLWGEGDPSSQPMPLLPLHRSSPP